MKEPTTETGALAVVGVDLDPSLCARLTNGDKVMVEINGVRVYSRHACPLVAEQPWTVISSTPPRRAQGPTESNMLVLRHAFVNHDLVLHYTNLLVLAKRQPAVFQEKDANLSRGPDGQPLPIYVVLQLVSHWICLSFVIIPPHPFRQAGTIRYKWGGLFRPRFKAHRLEATVGLCGH